MRRLSAIFVLLAWLLASGAQWDLMQSFAWGRMVVNYSRTMSLSEAVRLSFDANNLCGVCEFVADNKTRAGARDAASDAAPATGDAAKGKLILAATPHPIWVFASVTEPEWPMERCIPASLTRPAPPTEPPRAV